MATTINVILADSTTAITVSTGARGPAGTSAANSVTSATTSDGTADLYIDSLRFETTNGGPTQLGEMAWESTDGSIDAMLESGVIVAMGEDLVIRVRNSTMTPIAKGAALAYDGTVGASGRIDVKPWVGSNISTAKLFLGFAAAAIPANSNGYAQWFGKLSGIDTDGGAENWQDEQIIYAVPSASSTLTNVAPTSGEYAVVAVVINAGSGTSGILYVRPTFESIQSITTATPTNINGLLKGNGSTVSAATAGTDYAAAVHTHVSADITDATSDGQSNPGKVLKTDANGALQIEELTLGNSSVGTAGGVRIVGTTNTATIFNDDDSTAALKFGSTSGAIMVDAANLGDLDDKKAAVTNLVTVVDNANTSITLADANSGTILRTTSSSAVSIEVPSTLAAGFNILIIQGGSGQVTITAGSGATVNSYGSLTKTAGQHAAATIVRVASATYNLSGNLA